MGYAILFGLFIIAGGAKVAIEGDVPIGIITIVSGVMFLSMFLDVGKPARIDVSVRNKIIAHDGNGRYLVEAKTSRQIRGPRPHVSGNLPAHLIEVKMGLWIVDSNNYTPNLESKKINWLPMDGNYHVEPRGNTKTGGFLADVMEGYYHEYIVKDDK